MDSISFNDLIFECIRAFVMIALLTILFLRGNFTSLARHPGWKSILVGFCLITVATLLDITDEIPGLEKYVIIGDTIYEAFLEKMPGYLLGFVMVMVGFYKMIPSLQKAEQNEQYLHESEERFRQMFEGNPDSVILAKLDSGEIIDVNPSFELQTGFKRDDMLGRNPSELDLLGSQKSWTKCVELMQRTGGVNNFETAFKIKGGTVLPSLLSAQEVMISGDPCTLMVIRDITKLKEAEHALLETDRVRGEFVSTAAHELRTPLSVVTGYAEILTDPDICNQFSSKEQYDFLEEIKAKGFVLNKIIDDLLDLNRIDSGLKFGLQFELINPSSLIKKAFEQFQLQSNSHRFCLDLSPDNDFEVECDGQRVLQVLANLLSNAIKYSPKKSLVTLSSIHHPERFEFSVIDNGIGMTPDQVEQVFDKFYRVDSSDTAISGLGLGMSIVKQIVDGHNGTVTIESTIGKGTCVKVQLPKTRV
jgi:PAS domain S-box-containing protein